MADKSPEQKQTRKKGSKIVIAIVSIVIVVLIAIIVVLVLHKSKPEETKRNVVVNKENAEEVAVEMISQEYVPPGYYSASMTTTWHFATGDSPSEDSYVENVKENTNDVYFDIFLADQEDIPIFQSPVIPRGNELENIVLDIALDAGTYDCVMIYHLINDKQETLSTLRVGLTIIVEQ